MRARALQVRNKYLGCETTIRKRERLLFLANKFEGNPA
jgi:hypothetical protein